MAEGEGELFGEWARQDAPARDGGAARYVGAERNAIVFDRFEFDALIEADHPARVIWSYLVRVDVSALYARIGARTHTPGRPPPDPRVVLALLPDATGSLAFADAGGSTRTAYGINPNGSVTLVFADRNGRTRAGIGVDPRGGSMLTVDEAPAAPAEADTTD